MRDLSSTMARWEETAEEGLEEVEELVEVGDLECLEEDLVTEVAIGWGWILRSQ